VSAPTNISAATARELTWGDYVISDVDLLSAPYELWFKTTGQPNEVIQGIWAHALLASTYDPKVTVYSGPDPGSLSVFLGLENIVNRPIQVPTEEGEDRYFQVVQNGAGVPNAPLSFSVTKAPSGLAPAGSLIVNHDHSGFPAAILNASTGAIIGYVRLVAGELGEMLPNGVMLLSDEATGKTVLYNDSLAQIAT
jgi:hypothetical protein